MKFWHRFRRMFFRGIGLVAVMIAAEVLGFLFIGGADSEAGAARVGVYFCAPAAVVYFVALYLIDR